MSKNVSFVVPVYNEKETVAQLFAEVSAVSSQYEYEYELIFVDDGSTDGTYEAVRALIDGGAPVKLVRFRRNFGKAAALQAGFERASGEIVLTLDGDLQDDPKETPRFIEKLDEGFDMVSGWKQRRHDPLEKRLPSKLFNAVTAGMSGIPLHDFNCGFKAYRKEVCDSLCLYGEMHRYIPVLARRQGFSVGEIVVEHRARTHGKSKYGFERYLRGLFDSMTSSFLLRFGDRPMHFFGRWGLTMFAAGVIICVVLTAQWIGGASIGTRPLLLLGVLLNILGLQFFATGFTCDLLLDRTTRRNQNTAHIKELLGFEEGR